MTQDKLNKQQAPFSSFRRHTLTAVPFSCAASVALLKGSESLSNEKQSYTHWFNYRHPTSSCQHRTHEDSHSHGVQREVKAIKFERSNI